MESDKDEHQVGEEERHVEPPFLESPIAPEPEPDYGEDDLASSEPSAPEKKDKLKSLRSPQQDMLISEYKEQFAKNAASDDDASTKESMHDQTEYNVQHDGEDDEDQSRKISVSRSPEHNLLIDEYRERIGSETKPDSNADREERKSHLESDSHHSEDEGEVQPVRAVEYNFDSDFIKEVKLGDEMPGSHDEENDFEPEQHHEFGELTMTDRYDEEPDALNAFERNEFNERISENDRHSERETPSYQEVHSEHDRESIHEPIVFNEPKREESARSSRHSSRISFAQVEPETHIPAIPERQINTKIDPQMKMTPKPFEESTGPADVSVTKNVVRSRKSHFEGGQEVVRKPGHPPEVKIDFGKGSYEHEESEESEEEKEEPPEEKIDYHVSHVEEPPRTKVDMKQKPIHEILPLFGGKATKEEKLERLRQPAVEKRAEVAKVSSGVQTSRKIKPQPEETQSDEHLQPVSEKAHQQAPPKVSDESKFSSVRIVKNVRNFVKQQQLANEEADKQAAKMAELFASKKVEKQGPQRVEAGVQVCASELPPSPVEEPEPEPVHEQEHHDEEELPVSERKRLFENLQHAHYRDSTAHYATGPISPKPRETKVAPEQQPSTPPRAPKKVDIGVGDDSQYSTSVTPDEIKEATQEISDCISTFAPVSQRKQLFERGHH